MTLRRLALAALLLAPTVPAQLLKFPAPGGGWLNGSAALACVWNGKPALLLMGSGAYGRPGVTRIQYDGQWPPVGNVRQTPVFTLAAMLSYDSRPCASGLPQWLVDDDYRGWLRLGNLDGGGLLVWQGSYRIAFNRYYTSWSKSYAVNECVPGGAYQTPCGVDCRGPDFVAMVLTIDGLAW